jgi:hypothetical protein
MTTVSTTLPRSVVAGDHIDTSVSHAARTTFIGLCLVFAAIGYFTANGLVTSAAFAVLPLLTFLLWRPGEPPVLLFGCIFQWMQATAAIFYTNHLGVTLEEAFGSYELEIATWLSIFAVVALAVGIRCGFIGAGPSQGVALEADAAKTNVRKVAVLYAVSVIVSGVLDAAAWRIPSITQILLAAASVKWAIVFVLCYTVFHQRRGYGLLVGCVAIEFAMGLFGIYANFKSVFFVLLVAALSSPQALRGRRLVTTVVCFVILFVLGVVWTAVKMDYREFLADETSGSEDTIPIERRFEKLGDLIEGVSWDNFTDGIDALVLRVSYVNFFALAVENVPGRVPYENGELWKDSVMHILTPRVLFPDKPALDDSERTRLYTGINVAGTESGTSIGIGYVGESYIDFGAIGMFAPIFTLGILYGLINRFFISRARHKLLGASLAVSVLVFNAYAMESSNIKLLGGVVGAALVSVVIYLVSATSIANYLRQTPARDVRTLHRR